MTATGHAVIGTLIAAKIGNPVIAIPIALSSHFLADLFPHWDTGTHWKEKSKQVFLLESFLDVALSFVVAYLMVMFLFPQTNIWYTFFIVLVAQSPDWVMAPYLFFKNKFPLFKLAYLLQSKTNTKLDKPWGIINQIAILIFITILAKLM